MHPMKVGAMVAALAMGLGACSSSTEGDRSIGEGAADDLGVGHIHGLGLNPTDGELYAGGHHGVFRISEDGASRMGDLIQDTMGFTVAGADRFLGSGHPDLRNDTILDDGDPPLLGLIESVDNGRTWEGVSLQGEVDFHALQAAHGRIYGADATNGRFLVSEDGRQWETRADIGLVSLAVSPEDPDVIIATTPAELVRSTDGGRSWRADPSWPPLAFLSWDPMMGAWGATADGNLHHSGDGGISWSFEGSAGTQPSALLAAEGALYVAASEAVVESRDGGTTWSTLTDLS